MNVELHSDVELQNEGNAQFDSEFSSHERECELPHRNVHSDSDAEKSNMEIRT